MINVTNIARDSGIIAIENASPTRVVIRAGNLFGSRGFAGKCGFAVAGFDDMREKVFNGILRLNRREERIGISFVLRGINMAGMNEGDGNGSTER